MNLLDSPSEIDRYVESMGHTTLDEDFAFLEKLGNDIRMARKDEIHERSFYAIESFIVVFYQKVLSGESELSEAFENQLGIIKSTIHSLCQNVQNGEVHSVGFFHRMFELGTEIGRIVDFRS